MSKNERFLRAVSEGASADEVKQLLGAGRWSRRWLLPWGAVADPNARDEEGRTALMLAVKAGRADLVRAIAALGADMNLRDHHGRTSLFYSQSFEMDELLVYLGANSRAMDHSRMYVHEYREEEIITRRLKTLEESIRDLRMKIDKGSEGEWLSRRVYLADIKVLEDEMRRLIVAQVNRAQAREFRRENHSDSKAFLHLEGRLDESGSRRDLALSSN